MLSSINIDIENIKIVLANVKEELDLVKKQIRDRLRHENEYIKQVYNLFVEYAKELNVEKTISPKEDYIFTDNLKCRTGANFQKLIIAYKIAVLKVVESVINKKLIFVMDSPKAKELDDNNTKQIMSFLKAKLSENQVLPIRSIRIVTNKKTTQPFWLRRSAIPYLIDILVSVAIVCLINFTYCICLYLKVHVERFNEQSKSSNLIAFLNSFNSFDKKLSHYI